MPIKRETLGSTDSVVDDTAAVETEEFTKEEDLRYFVLRKPIQIGDTKLEKLLIDPTQLTGPIYFKLIERFRKEYPDLYRVTFNVMGEPKFLALVIAELNPPMTPEDLAKLSFTELPLLFMRTQAFVFREQN